MLFEFRAYSALLLPFVLPGAVLALHLVVRAARFGHLPDGLLGLLIFLNVLPVAQWMLGYAGWYDSHNGYSTAMFYIPWQPWLGWGPTFYLYFRSLTNQEFQLRQHWKHLLPQLVYVGLYAAAALYDLGWSHGLRGQALPLHFGTKGLASSLLDSLGELVGWLGYALMLGYGLATLRRYRRYLDDNFSDTARLRFRGLRDLLVAALLGLLLWPEFFTGMYLQQEMFWGFVLLLATGAGQWSVDGWLRRRTWPFAYGKAFNRATLVTSVAVLAAVLVAVPVVAGWPSDHLHSDLLIEPGKQFLLGGDQPGAFKVVAKNKGNVAVEIKERTHGGGIFGKAILQPGQRGVIRFAACSRAVLLNPSSTTANMDLTVTGDISTLSMNYEPVGTPGFK